MAIQAMKKVQVVTLKSSAEAVLELLQKQEAFELVATDNQGDTDVQALRTAQKNVADLDFAIKYLTPYQKQERGFSYALMGVKEIFSEKRVEEIVRQFNFQEIVSQTQEIEVTENVKKARVSDIQKELDVIRAFESFKGSLQAVRSQKSVDIVFGRIATPEFALFKERVEEIAAEQELQVISEDAAETVFFVVIYKDFTVQLKELMKKSGAAEVVLSEECDDVVAYIKGLESEKAGLEKEIDALEVEAVKVANELPKLKACYDYFVWKRESQEVVTQGIHTEYAVVLTGWLAADKFTKLETELKQLTQSEATMVEIEPEEGEEAPVELKNKSFVKPFEMVTRMYGLPTVHELDPTPYLSLFFLVFFGFCLTDMLYGVLLSVICFAVLKFMKVPREMKGLFTLVGVCGLSTAVLGVLFGGYAGIPVPEMMQGFQLFDTTDPDDIVKIMALTFGIGFVQLWFGTLIAGTHAWVSGKKLEAISLHFSWTAFFALIGLSQFVIQDAQIAKYTLWGALVMISAGLSYGTQNIFLKLIVGPFNFIQEVIGWGSNILSYARLFALGLATGVIAMVFNEIAIIISGMLPAFVGIPVMILIILFGHTLNIAINVLGAFIHSARLQFVEFFGKFLAGGGRRFNPFSRKSTYVYLEK